VTWAADNGCFAQGARFDLDAFLAWLAGLDGRERCLFAVAPDVVGDAEATLTRSADVLPRIRALGYRAALVAQDGLERLAVPWDDVDALFIGGTTAWKLSEAAYALAAEAVRRGKWTHMGRVNGEGRLRAAAAAGYDSADGTGLAINPGKNWRLMRGWLDRLDGQPPLWVTPLTADAQGSKLHQHRKDGTNLTILGQAIRGASAWPTPYGFNGQGEGQKYGSGGEFAKFITNWSGLDSLPDPPTETGGPATSNATPTSRRQLNPRFVEALMGLPPGWTDFEDSGTPSCRSKPRPPCASSGTALSENCHE
jgi:hypothetical protein